MFLHVSTAYCNLEQKIVNETLYPIDIRSEDLINALEKIDDKTLKILTPKYVPVHRMFSRITSINLNNVTFCYRLLGEYFPNTYTFGKRITEQLVGDFMEKMPVTIVRPSISKFHINLIYALL